MKSNDKIENCRWRPADQVMGLEGELYLVDEESNSTGGVVYGKTTAWEDGYDADV